MSTKLNPTRPSKYLMETVESKELEKLVKNKAKQRRDVFIMAKQVRDLWDIIKERLTADDLKKLQTSVNVRHLLIKLKTLKEGNQLVEDPPVSPLGIQELREIVAALRANVRNKVKKSPPKKKTPEPINKKKMEIKEIYGPKPKTSNVNKQKKIPTDEKKKPNSEKPKPKPKMINDLTGVKFYKVKSAKSTKISESEKKEPRKIKSEANNNKKFTKLKETPKSK